MATFVITADSTPVYDTWGWADYWSCEDWINWHKALKVAYGKSVADQTWLNAWNKQDSFEHNLNWCKYGAAFNDYATAEGLPVTHLLSDVISGGTKVGSNLIGAGVSASKIPTNIANVLKWLIPVVLVIAVIGGLVYANKKYKIFST